MIKLCLKIAIKFLTHKVDGTLGFVRKTFFLAFIALSISILSLIILDSFSSGYIDSFKQKISSIESDIYISKYDNQKITKEEILRITTVLDSSSGIQGYSIEAVEKGIIKDVNLSEGVVVRSILANRGNYLSSFIEKNTNTSLDEKECIVGKGLKKRLNIKNGSSITLLNTNFINTGFFFNSALSSKVVNNFHFRIPELDNSTVFIHKKDFDKIFDYKYEEASNVKIFLKSLDIQDEVVENLKSQLIQESLDFYILTFDDRYNVFLSTLFDIFDSISIVIYILTIICLFNIGSSLWLIIESKNKDINVLRLLGMSNIRLYFIFFTITTTMVFLAFLVAYISSLGLIGIQNTFQLISLPVDVYIVENLKGVLDYRYLVKILSILFLSAIILSILTFVRNYFSSKGRVNV